MIFNLRGQDDSCFVVRVRTHKAPDWLVRNLIGGVLGPTRPLLASQTPFQHLPAHTQLGPSTHGMSLFWFYYDNFQWRSFLYIIAVRGFEQFHRMYWNCLTRLASLDMQLVSIFMQYN